MRARAFSDCPAAIAEGANNDAVVERPALTTHAARPSPHLGDASVRTLPVRMCSAADFGFAPATERRFVTVSSPRSHPDRSETVSGNWIVTPSVHQRIAFPLPEKCVDFGPNRTRIASQHFARIGGHCATRSPLAFSAAMASRQVQLAMLVVRLHPCQSSQSFSKVKQ